MTDTQHPLTAFSQGRDSQLVIIGPNGRVDLSHLRGVETEQLTRKITVNRIDGTSLHAEMPVNWIGTIRLERPDPIFREAVDGEDTPATMYQYVMEPDGSVATYQFDRVTFAFADDMRVEFSADRRRRV